MEIRLVAWIKTFFMVLGCLTCLFFLVNGASEFWSRHAMSRELVQLMSQRYSWEADEPENRVSKHK